MSTNRFVGHLLPQLAALLAELGHRKTRVLGLDLFSRLVHPDEVGRRVPLGLARKFDLLLLPFALGAATAAAATER